MAVTKWVGDGVGHPVGIYSVSVEALLRQDPEPLQQYSPVEGWET